MKSLKVYTNSKEMKMFDILKDTTKFFVKMSLQSSKFSKYNMSTNLISCTYAALKLIEQSMKPEFNTPKVQEFCTCVR